MLEVDASLFARVLINLLDNAVKYTPHAQIRIGVKAVGQRMYCFVDDEGPGFPAVKRQANDSARKRGASNIGTPPRLAAAGAESRY